MATLKNITINDTGHLTVASGTTLQRPASPVVGMIRYNTTLSLLEQYGANGWEGIEAPPTVTSISGTINADTNSTLTVNGTGFKSGSTVYIEGVAVSGGSRSLVTTFVSSSQVTAATNAASVNYTGGASFDVKVLNPSGLSSVLSGAGTIDRDPLWTTASGSVATVFDNLTNGTTVATLVASDPDGTSIAYSVVSGALPTGMSLNSSTGVISVTSSIAIASATTSSFTVRATSNSQTVDREFSITVNLALDGSTSARAASSALTLYNDYSLRTDGNYWINISGTAAQIHCLLSSTFAAGFYSPNSAKAGWTQFAQQYTPTAASLNIESDTGTVSTSSTASWARSTFKQSFDTGGSFSSETEVLIDIDNTHTFIFDGWRGISRSLANSQIDIIRGYSGGNAVMSEGTWNSTTSTSNSWSGCGSCSRPRYKFFNSSNAVVGLGSNTSPSNGNPCSDWCDNGYGVIYTEYAAPFLSRGGNCFSPSGPGSGNPCGYSGVSLSGTGTLTKYYFRQRPV
jgi:hypothetical protein